MSTKSRLMGIAILNSGKADRTIFGFLHQLFFNSSLVLLLKLQLMNMKVSRRKISSLIKVRTFSISIPRREIRDVKELPDCKRPSYHRELTLALFLFFPGRTMAKRANADRETRDHDLLALHWPSSPRNILLVKKRNAAATTESLLEFAK